MSKEVKGQYKKIGQILIKTRKNFFLIFVLSAVFLTFFCYLGSIVSSVIQSKQKEHPVIQEGSVNKVSLSCLALKSVWVTVTIDGVPAYTGLLKEGYQREWEADYSIELKCNDFSEVNVIIDHHPLKEFGKSFHQVKSILILPQEIGINIELASF